MNPTTSIDFAVPTHYTIGDRFPTWQEAVDAAHAKIVTHTYKGQMAKPEDDPRRYADTPDGLQVHSRAFVHMREVTRLASGGLNDGVARTWEVFADGTAETMGDA